MLAARVPLDGRMASADGAECRPYAACSVSAARVLDAGGAHASVACMGHGGRVAADAAGGGGEWSPGVCGPDAFALIDADGIGGAGAPRSMAGGRGCGAMGAAECHARAEAG